MDNLITIPLSKRGKYKDKYETKIDDADKKLADYSWQACVYPHKETVYARGRYEGKHRFLHDIILEQMLGYPIPEGQQCDHIDGDGLNNCRNNLRSVTQSQNQMNRGLQKNNKSGFKGVHFDKKSQKYRARIGVEGKRFNLGLFDTPEQASEACHNKRLELHKEFARFE